MQTLRARWIYVRCACGTIEPLAVQLLLREEPGLAARTLADVVVYMRCRACGRRPATIHLCADAHGPGPRIGGPDLRWSVLLHEAAVFPSEATDDG